MLEAYLNPGEPLTVSTPRGKIVFKNMNAMTTRELYDAVEAAETTKRRTVLLSMITLEDEKKLIPTLTSNQAKQIIQQWEIHSGVTLEVVLQVFHIVENYPTQLQADLGQFTNLNTVSELLSLKVIDIVTVTSGLLQETGRRSYIVAKLMGTAQPWSPEYNTELLLLTAVNILRNFGKSESISLDKFKIKTTDNNSSDTTENKPTLDPVQAEKLKAWRETGKLSN